MTAIPLDEVQPTLPELIHRLAPGEQVIITEDNLPVAQLVGLRRLLLCLESWAG